MRKSVSWLLYCMLIKILLAVCSGTGDCERRQGEALLCGFGFWKCQFRGTCIVRWFQPLLSAVEFLRWWFRVLSEDRAFYLDWLMYNCTVLLMWVLYLDAASGLLFDYINL